ncbi:hypothetical protein [Sphingomicrobium nitratireducens]|uniref:hypothetical protein n=1 Tax=Sphingomicrobium nitratireducens TaxID=2964666 RepID=UPI00223FFB0E|nr:hypothetical protein [Sphingomicrobium nitratireducens]
MKKLILTAAATLVLAACGEADAPVEEATTNEVVEEAAEAAPAEPAGSIEGNLTLTAMGGQPVPDTVQVSGSASGGKISLKSHCANMSWPFELNGNLITMGEGSGVSGGCVADRTTYEYAVAKAMNQANIAMFNEGEVMLSGPGGSVTLAMK